MESFCALWGDSTSGPAKSRQARSREEARPPLDRRQFCAWGHRATSSGPFERQSGRSGRARGRPSRHSSITISFLLTRCVVPAAQNRPAPRRRISFLSRGRGKSAKWIGGKPFIAALCCAITSAAFVPGEARELSPRRRRHQAMVPVDAKLWSCRVSGLSPNSRKDPAGGGCSCRLFLPASLQRPPPPPPLQQEKFLNLRRESGQGLGGKVRAFERRLIKPPKPNHSCRQRKPQPPALRNLAKADSVSPGIHCGQQESGRGVAS